MEPLRSADVAVGWALITGVALAAYYGFPLVIGILVRTVSASLAQQRPERERIQDELDEVTRQQLLSILIKEAADRTDSPTQIDR